MVSSIEYCRAQIDDLKERIREYTRRHEDAAMILDGLNASLEVQQKLLASELDRRLKKEQDVAADTTCADTAARMRKCYEDASGKHYKPMGELDAWHHKHPPQPERELAAQLPLMADAKPEDAATIAGDDNGGWQDIYSDLTEGEIGEVAKDFRQRQEAVTKERKYWESLQKENDSLRDIVARSNLDCVHCGLPAADMAKCKSGFPGCARADDFDISKMDFPELPPAGDNDEFMDGFGVATVASDEADVSEIVTAGKRDCEACHGGPCPRNDDCPLSVDNYRDPWIEVSPAVVDSMLANQAKPAVCENADFQKRDIPWQPLPEEFTESNGWIYVPPVVGGTALNVIINKKKCAEQGIELGEFIAWIGGRPFFVAKTPLGNAIARVESGTAGFEVLPGEEGSDTRDCRNWTEQRPDLEIAKHYRQAYDKALEDGKLPEHPRFRKPANGKQFIGWFSSKGKSADYWIGEFFGETALIRVPENNLAGHRTVNWLPHPDDFAAALERAEELGLATVATDEPIGSEGEVAEWSAREGKHITAPESTDSRGVRYEGGRMVSKTGAVRSSDAQHERYDLIGTVGLRRLAETYAEGALKYTDDNWLKGFPVSDILNHTFRHFVLYRAGDCSEDHLAHAAFGLFAAMHYEENNPDCIDIKARLNPDGTVKQYRRWWENPE